MFFLIDKLFFELFVRFLHNILITSIIKIEIFIVLLPLAADFHVLFCLILRFFKLLSDDCNEGLRSHIHGHCRSRIHGRHVP